VSDNVTFYIFVYSSSYDILVKDESSLSQEINAYERRFDLWDKNNVETVVDPPKPSQNRISWQAPVTLPAVNKFEVYACVKSVYVH